MKRMKPLSGALRYVLLLLTVTAVSLGFLYLPLPQKTAPPSTSFDYFNYLAGSTDGRQAADTVAPESIANTVPVITQAHFYRKIEAESLSPLPPDTAVLTKRAGYSGKGYVGVLPAATESVIEFPVEISETQHYQITLCAASQKSGRHILRVNGEPVSKFMLETSKQLMRITFYGIFLEKGSNTIAFDTIDSALEIDYIEIENDSSMYQELDTSEAALSDPDASDAAVHLYDTMRRLWGKAVITGQYVADQDNAELQFIYQETGQLPAIRFSTLSGSDDREQVQSAIDWNLYLGGVIGLSWQWNAPETGSVYTEESDFDLYSALRQKDAHKVAMLGIDDAQRAADSGSLHPNAVKLLRDIDEMAETLRPLANMDIPVLWRPLPEAGGGWYWWGGFGKQAYLRLWTLLYDRLTKYHGLHNLIWIWNGQSAAYLVPENQYDIAAVDIYLQDTLEYGSRYEQYQSLKQITDGRKLLALSECSNVPDPEKMQIDSSLWSFFGLWYGAYLDPNCAPGIVNDYSSNDLYNVYNSELCLSLNDFLSYYQ